MNNGSEEHFFLTSVAFILKEINNCELNVFIHLTLDCLSEKITFSESF